MEKETVEISAGIAKIGIGIVATGGVILGVLITKNWDAIKIKYLSKNKEGSNVVSKEDFEKIKNERDDYKKELREREIKSLAEIIDAVKLEIESLKKAFHDDLKEEIKDLKNFFEEKYTTKENFFLLLQLVGKLSGEVSTFKNRSYPILETAKRDLVNRGVDIVSADVYNDNTEINNLLSSLYQNFNIGKR